MLRHHNVAVDAKAEVAAHALKGVLKDSSAGVGREQGTAVITTKGYEMALPGVVITLKAPGHELSVACSSSPLKAKEALSGPPCFKMELSAALNGPPTVNVESVTAPHPVQGGLEDSAACACCKQATAMVTAECDEMTLSAVVEAC